MYIDFYDCFIPNLHDGEFNLVFPKRFSRELYNYVKSLSKKFFEDYKLVKNKINPKTKRKIKYNTRLLKNYCIQGFYPEEFDVDIDEYLEETKEIELEGKKKLYREKIYHISDILEKRLGVNVKKNYMILLFMIEDDVINETPEIIKIKNMIKNKDLKGLDLLQFYTYVDVKKIFDIITSVNIKKPKIYLF